MKVQRAVSNGINSRVYPQSSFKQIVHEYVKQKLGKDKEQLLREDRSALLQSSREVIHQEFDRIDNIKSNLGGRESEFLGDVLNQLRNVERMLGMVEKSLSGGGATHSDHNSDSRSDDSEPAPQKEQNRLFSPW